MKYGLYKELSKEEQKKIRKEYEKTKKGYDLTKRLNRLIVTGSLCAILAITATILLIIGYLEWYFILITIGLYICAPLFLIGQYKLRMQLYCRFIKLKEKHGK